MRRPTRKAPCPLWCQSVAERRPCNICPASELESQQHHQVKMDQTKTDTCQREQPPRAERATSQTSSTARPKRELGAMRLLLLAGALCALVGATSGDSPPRPMRAGGRPKLGAAHNQQPPTSDIRSNTTNGQRLIVSATGKVNGKLSTARKSQARRPPAQEIDLSDRAQLMAMHKRQRIHNDQIVAHAATQMSSASAGKLNASESSGAGDGRREEEASPEMNTSERRSSGESESIGEPLVELRPPVRASKTSGNLRNSKLQRQASKLSHNSASDDNSGFDFEPATGVQPEVHGIERSGYLAPDAFTDPHRPIRNGAVAGQALALAAGKPLASERLVDKQNLLLDSRHEQLHADQEETGYTGGESSYPVAPHTRYSPLDATSGLLVDSSGKEKHQSNIKVVFNNNPQFIIGRDQGALHDELGGSPLQRRTRQPAASLYQDDQYHSDESKLEETKVAAKGVTRQVTQEATDDDLPCRHKDKHHKGGDPPTAPNFDKIDLTSQEPVPVPPVKQELPPIGQQPVQSKLDKSSPPPEPQSVQRQLALEQQVDTPLEQMIKSGIRPPLRMVISMRNKNGDTMKVPINLHGSAGKQPAFDLASPMQIHFESPLLELAKGLPAFQPQQQQQQQVEDENTPPGGDFFDPSLVKPFARKTAGKTVGDPASKSRPVMPEPVQVKEPVQAKEPVQVREPVQVKEAPPSPQEPIVVQEPQVVERPPAVKEPQVVQEPQVLEKPRVAVKETQTKEPAEQQVKEPASVKRAREERPVQVQVKEQVPEIQPTVAPQVLPVATRRPADCEQQQQQQSDDGDNEPLGPISVNAADGLVHLMTPRLSQFQNRTFADMFVQFQRALSEQMSRHSEQPRAPPSTSSSNSRQEDEQEDMMVAMLAANASQGGPQSEKQVAMTVIRPPKGTTVEEAIMMHARQAPEGVGHTVAILKAQPRAGTSNRADFAERPASPDSRPVGVDVQLKRGGNPSPVPLQPSLDVDSPVDPDGFSSSSNQQLTRAEAGQSGSAAAQQRSRLRRSPEPSGRASSSGRGQPEKPEKSGGQRREKDSLVGAASEQNEVADEDSAMDEDEDEDSAGQSSNQEPRTAQSGDGADDSHGDLDDESADSSNFDAADADEPFNQGASSERDYNSPSFEIPQIEINPESLKQRGCRTVLREVQEIPMNGLGVVRADGRPGSGFAPDAIQAAGSSRLEGVRVRRQAPSDNLINSRKVTSIVMTKECHFPNETPSPKPALEPKEPAAGQAAAASRSRLQFQKPPTGGLQKVDAANQRQQLSLDGQLANADQFYLAQRRPRNAQDQFRLLQQPMSHQQQQPMYSLVKRPSPARLLPDNNLPTLQRAADEGSIKRRSVPDLRRPEPARAPAPTADTPRFGPNKAAPTTRDIHVGLDSRRNEVVAQKVYRPPSKENPYHLLSYSSRNGADPDGSDLEDDENFSNDEPADEDSSGGRRAQPAASNRQRTRETLSERERQALMDPNYDDTDPAAPEASGKKEAGRARRPKQAEVADADENDDDLADESRQSRVRQPPLRDPGAGQQQEQEPSRFGKSFKFQHEIGRPKLEGLMGQLRDLQPGRQGFVAAADEQRKAAKALQRREAADNEQDPDEQDEAYEDERPRGQPAGASSEPAADEEDPDADPDYNPKETHLPAHSKPKRVQKSFAYVHRDLPRKGAPNPDDFVVSYGRGNLQTEQEDYDSDRPDKGAAASEDANNNNASERAASSTRVRALPAPAAGRRPTKQPQPAGQEQLKQQKPTLGRLVGPNQPVPMRFG